MELPAGPPCQARAQALPLPAPLWPQARSSFRLQHLLLKAGRTWHLPLPPSFCDHVWGTVGAHALWQTCSGSLHYRLASSTMGGPCFPRADPPFNPQLLPLADPRPLSCWSHLVSSLCPPNTVPLSPRHLGPGPGRMSLTEPAREVTLQLNPLVASYCPPSKSLEMKRSAYPPPSQPTVPMFTSVSCAPHQPPPLALRNTSLRWSRSLGSSWMSPSLRHLLPCPHRSPSDNALHLSPFGILFILQGPIPGALPKASSESCDICGSPHLSEAHHILFPPLR